MSKNITKFDSNAFKFGHRPEVVEPLADAGQLRIDGRVRVIVRGPDDRIVYDSQNEQGEAGIFAARDDAIEHGMSWIEARIRQALRREQLEEERRWSLADIEATSQKREADLRAQRKDMTAAINRERKIQAALAAEARDPAVRIDFRGGVIFDVVDEPSVFAGTLDAEGREVKKAKTSHRVVLSPKPPKVTAVPDEAPTEAPAKAPAKLAAVADDVPDYGSAEELDGLDGYTNGLLPAADLLGLLEDRRDEWAEGTLAAIAWGERSRKKRRGALDEWLSMALHEDGETDQREAILEADGGVEACLAAARLLTSTTEKSSAITGWAAAITCSATLGFALARERGRAKPRAKLIATLEARLEEIEPFGGAI